MLLIVKLGEKKMERKRIKSVILSSIGLLSAVALLVSMSLYFVYSPIVESVSGAIDEAVKKAVQTADSGFSMLGFKSAFLFGEEYEFVPTLMGVSSIVTLIFSVIGMLFVGLSFFMKEEVGRRTVKAIIIINVIIAIVYLVTGIVASSMLNFEINNKIDELVNKSNLSEWEEGQVESLKNKLVKTASYWAFIIQVLFLILYIVADKVDHFVLTEEKEQKSAKSWRAGKESFAQKENLAIETILEYNKRFEEGNITAMEFDRKKQLVLFRNKKISVQTELEIAKLIDEYKKLYEGGYISVVDYDKKKEQLLSYQK